VFIDSLNQHSAFGSQFQGADYYQYDAAGTQSIALKQSIRVPVQSSDDIEVNGISVGSMMKVYSWIRNKQWLVGGDILTAGDQTVLRLRLDGEGVAKYWEITDSGRIDGVSLIRRATEAMLAEQNPEMLGRSFLQQHQYSRAIEIFRSWALNEPRNWKPSYYLSLAFDYEGHTREALCLARWSADIAMQEKQMAALEAKKLANSNTGNPAQLAAVTFAVSEMNKVPNDPAKSVAEASGRLAVLRKTEKSLDDLASNNPSNLNYSIQLARTLDRQADLELNPLARVDEAAKDENRAIDLLDKAIKQAPENGGLYEQRSIFLQRKIMIAGKQELPGDLIAEMKKEENDGFRRALELSPRNDSPL
jgi:tetratricopeptide (TPR) repeat protein